MKRAVVHDFVRLTLVALGVLSLLLFLALVTSDLWDRRHYRRTEVVVEEKTVTAYGKTNIRASVSYLHPNGRRYGVELPPGFKIGDTVQVIYDPNYPKSAVVETFSGVWGTPLFFASAGVALTAIGLISRSKAKSNSPQ